MALTVSEIQNYLNASIEYFFPLPTQVHTTANVFSPCLFGKQRNLVSVFCHLQQFFNYLSVIFRFNFLLPLFVVVFT